MYEANENGCTSNQEQPAIGYLPRYAIPNTASLLPVYTNSEQEFITRAFNTGNYDSIKHLPDDIKYRQVLAARAARMEAARQALVPSIGGNAGPNGNLQGLFQVFEYQTTPFDMESRLESHARVVSEAKRMAIGGKEFTPAGAISKSKFEGLTELEGFKYLGGPYEDTDDLMKAFKALEESKIVGGPFVPPGTDKLALKPTRQIAWDMMCNLRAWIRKDWSEAEVCIYENEHDEWVIRISQEGVDSLDGLKSYMDVMARCNPLVLDYKLTRVPEHWHSVPDDGGVYYVVRPPWIKARAVSTFFAIHPEEIKYATSQGAQEYARLQEEAAAIAVGKAQDECDDDVDDMGRSKTRKHTQTVNMLSKASRLDWGVNFLTGTAGTASSARVAR